MFFKNFLKENHQTIKFFFLFFYSVITSDYHKTREDKQEIWEKWSSSEVKVC